jgi:hypothetical protein
VTTDRGAVGLTIDAGVRYSLFSAALEGRVDPPLGGPPIFGGGTANFTRVTGALLLCAHYAWFVGCTKGEGGRLMLLGNVYPSTYRYAAVGVRLGLDFPAAAPRFYIRVAGELLGTINPATVKFQNQGVLQVAGANTGAGFGVLFVMDKP